MIATSTTAAQSSDASADPTPTPVPPQTATQPPNDRPSPFIESLLQPLLGLDEKAEALRTTEFLRGEGDRLSAAGQTAAAREKWLDAIDAYHKGGNKIGITELYLELADSYMIQAIFDFLHDSSHLRPRQGAADDRLRPKGIYGGCRCL